MHLPSTEKHVKLHAFLNTPSKRKIVRAGRRGAKTTGLAKAAVLGLLEARRVLYAVPTADQLTRFWHIVVNALAELIEFGIYRKYEGDKIIEKPGTKERIKAKTAWNADSLRGDYADLLILDEFQLMNEDTWGIVGLPMLMDNNGDAVLIYTPPSVHTRSVSKATDKRHAAKMFKQCQSDPRWLCAHWTSHDNPYISQAGIAEVSGDMTALAVRQEIMAEDIDEVPGALWKMTDIERNRVKEIPPEALPLVRVVVGLDPTGSSTNEAGIVAAGMGRNGHGYVLEDASLLAPTSLTWAREAARVYHDRKADRILGETNYGGDMVEQTIRTADETVSYKNVNATRGKQVRAEPIAALYEEKKDLIHHVGTFEKLEEEMCSYVPLFSKVSPNRMDALVWALTELFPERLRLLSAEELARLQAATEDVPLQKTVLSTLPKAATNDKTAACPHCGTKNSVVHRGRSIGCSQCGKWWSDVVSATVGGRVGLFD